MFAKLGDFIVRAWPAILVAWVVALVCAVMVAPDLDSVAETEEFAFLPQNCESHLAEELFRKAFPDGFCPSRIVIIARRTDKPLSVADEKFLDDNIDEEGISIDHPDRKYELREHLRQLAEKYSRGEDRSNKKFIANIRSFRDSGLGNLLESKDRRAKLMIVELSTEFLDSWNKPVVGELENLLHDDDFMKQKPDGLKLSLSGEATVGRDMLDAAKNSAKATEWLTVVLVLVLLGAIYRAPLMAIIPLLTVAVALKFSMAILILCAQWNLVRLFEGIQVYVAVLMYGAGVDYCLFLIARYKEEIDAGVSYEEAISNCVSKVGAAIAASAATVICGIGMMVFAQFGKFHEAGIAISFGLTIVLIASLTFTPAFLRLAGKWAFWPQLRTERVSGGWISTSSLWSRISEIHWLQNIWEIVGNLLIKMPMRIWLASIFLMVPFAIIGVTFYTHLSYGLLSDLARNCPSVQGTEAIRAHFPAGASGSISVFLENKNVDFSDESTGMAYVRELTESLKDHMKELRLAEVRSVAFPVGGDDSVIEERAGVRRGAKVKKSKEYYVSSVAENNMAGHVTRIEITAEVDPFSRDSIDHLNQLEDEIRRRLPDGLKQGSGTIVRISGSTSSIRDLKMVTDGDQVRIDTLVVIGVFAILVLLLRNVALCTYLIVTVLFSYLVALGATYSFFSLTDPHFAGLDWKVPMFLFTILIAVGEDYNIFLMTRIVEEQAVHGPVKGILDALSKTGRIISSCGIIMAGTFASLCAGSLKGMIQLGFALAFGVLLDTFVVRPILVPAYLVLLHSGRFGKIGVWLGGPPHPVDPAGNPISDSQSTHPSETLVK